MPIVTVIAAYTLRLYTYINTINCVEKETINLNLIRMPHLVINAIF